MPRVQQQWETVSSEQNGRQTLELQRFKVPGGYLYRVSETRSTGTNETTLGVALAFVPSPAKEDDDASDVIKQQSFGS